MASRRAAARRGDGTAASAPSALLVLDRRVHEVAEQRVRRQRLRLVLGVQYHPEASPGPQDSFYLFEKFVGMLG